MLQSGARAPVPAMADGAGGGIVLNGIEVTFGVGERQTRAIGHISGEVQPGAFVSIVGPSGCGKTTLLDVIAGLTAPTKGTVSIGGEPVAGPRTDTAIVF